MTYFYITMRAPKKETGRDIMLARVISFQVLPERLEEVDNAYRGSLLPETEKHDGFLSMLTLLNEETNEMLELTLWRDEEARRESERSGGLLEWKLNALEAITGEATRVENYELRLMS
jgi:hypothetical protein